MLNNDISKSEITNNTSAIGESNLTENNINNELDGYCIACLNRIPFNKQKPLCESCLDKKQYKYCHKCGEPKNISLIYPLCEPCFRKTMLKYKT
jgi:ribosomal protein S14